MSEPLRIVVIAPDLIVNDQQDTHALEQAERSRSLRIGLPLAKRIVELHGGHIRVGDSDSDEIQVLLELPTGAPQRNPMRLDMVQAQKYAADLAKLVSRQRKERA